MARNMMLEGIISTILAEHAQSARNRRCACGWRPIWPDDRIAAEYIQHREHLAEILASAVDRYVPWVQ